MTLLGAAPGLALEVSQAAHRVRLLLALFRSLTLTAYSLD